VLAGPGTDGFGEGRDADPHQLAAFALFGLLFAQFGVADLIERLLQGRMIVAAVVYETQRRGVRELILADEVLEP